MRDSGEQASDEGLEPLKLQPRPRTPLDRLAVTAQTLVTLVVIFARLAAVRAAAGVGRPGARPAAGGGRAAALADRHRAARDHERHHLGAAGQAELALANISGAMMIQATVPSGIGLLFTPWKFDTPLRPGRRRDDGVGRLPALGPAPGRLTAGAAGRGGRVLRRLRRRSGRHALSRGPGAVRARSALQPGAGSGSARLGPARWLGPARSGAQSGPRSVPLRVVGVAGGFRVCCRPPIGG